MPKILFCLLALLLIVSCGELPSPYVEHKIHTITKFQTNSSGMFLRKVFFKEYDYDGNLVRFIQFFSEGSCVVQEFFRQNENISIVKIKYFNKNNFLDSHFVSINTLTPTGKILKSIVINENGDTSKISQFVYDTLGNLIAYIEIADNKRTEFTYSYEYNSSGNLLKIIKIDNSQPQNKIIQEFSYDSQKHIVNLKIYESDNDELENVTLIYNNLGLILKEIHRNLLDGKIEYFEYKYTFY